MTHHSEQASANASNTHPTTKSLCPAGAGIINKPAAPEGSHTPPQACATPAIYLACQPPSEAPHAQLVEGYKGLRHRPLDSPYPESKLSPRFSHHLSVHIKHPLHLNSIHSLQRKELFVAVNNAPYRSLHQKPPGEQFCCRQDSLLKLGHCARTMTDLFQHVRDLSVERLRLQILGPDCVHNKIINENQSPLGSIYTVALYCFFLMSRTRHREPDSTENSGNGSKRLHPRRSYLRGPIDAMSPFSSDARNINKVEPPKKRSQAINQNSPARHQMDLSFLPFLESHRWPPADGQAVRLANKSYAVYSEGVAL